MNLRTIIQQLAIARRMFLARRAFKAVGAEGLNRIDKSTEVLMEAWMQRGNHCPLRDLPDLIDELYARLPNDAEMAHTIAGSVLIARGRLALLANDHMALGALQELMDSRIPQDVQRQLRAGALLQGGILIGQLPAEDLAFLAEVLHSGTGPEYISKRDADKFLRAIKPITPAPPPSP